MKPTRSEYAAQIAIARGIECQPRLPAIKPQKGHHRSISLALWFAIGLVIPFAALGIIQQWLATH
jgi:hypothetical protein